VRRGFCDEPVSESETQTKRIIVALHGHIHMIKDKTFHIVSLGCAKNTVDAESMAQLLSEAGYELVANPKKARVLIVNTCGFIRSAKEESLDALGELAQGKKKGQILIATGCLPQREGEEIVTEVPGIDAILGTRRWMDIVELVEKLTGNSRFESRYKISESATVGTDERGVFPFRVPAPISKLPTAVPAPALFAPFP
jgi:ribosomal protein S12 methylthiotransferase